ncbi:Nicotinamide-nucleotide amidohydrolase PncC [compost metagenome]
MRMNSIERVARFMQEKGLTLVTAESCTAGLISATLADIPGAGSLLDCAFVVYSVDAKMRCLGVPQSTLASHNLTSEAVARDMALGAARKSPANVAVSNTGVTDATDDRIPSGTQCYAWVFKRGQADSNPVVYTETKAFSGDRNAIRRASAEHALLGILEHYHRHHPA